MLARQVTQRIATCQPLSTALDNGHVILCDMMADPWVSLPNPPWIQSKWKGAGGGHEPRHVESGQGLWAQGWWESAKPSSGS